MEMVKPKTKLKVDWNLVRNIATWTRERLVSRTGLPPKDRCVKINALIAMALRGSYGDDVVLRYGAFRDDRNGEFHHWWVELDGHVIDATGDQFNRELIERALPQVYIGRRRDLYHPESAYRGLDIEKEARQNTTARIPEARIFYAAWKSHQNSPGRIGERDR